jgi:FtsH-binding integral membrane protein
MDYLEKSNLSYGTVKPVAMENTEVRADFYKKTYMHVALAFIVFLGLESVLFASGIANAIAGVILSSTIAMIAVMFGFSFAASYTQKMAFEATDRTKQYMALGLLILLESVIFIPIIFYAIHASGNDLTSAFNNILMPGIVITVAMFAGLVLTVFVTGKDFSFLKAAVGIGVMIMIGVAVIGMIFGFNIGSWFSIGMIVLMAGAILYQTSEVATQYHREQYVAASVSIFASFMTLLFYVIRLISSRD